MKVYYDKIKSIRKKQKISVLEICNKVGICRSTYWRWERNVSHPSETELKNIAHLLNVGIEEISDLPTESRISEKEIHESASAWMELVSKNTKFYDEKIFDIIYRLQNLNKSFNSIMLFVNGLLKNTNIAFYAKDMNYKYVIANASFLNFLSLPIEYNVLGKGDKDFFNNKEAEQNYVQDKEILNSGITINNHEQFIPGTRKKLWGLIYKSPIYDNSGKALGLISFIIDITEKKKSEELRTILEQSINSLNSAVTLLNIEKGNYFYINDSIYNVFGHLPELLKTWSREEKLKEVVYNDDIEIINSSLNYSLTLPLGTKNEYEFRIIRPDNKQLRWIRGHYIIVKYFGHLCKFTIFSDITQEKKRLNEKINIIKKLKNAGVETKIISNATGMKICDIENL